jgi:hypothetical protein
MNVTSFAAISASRWIQVALKNVRNLHDFFNPTIVNYWGLLVSFLRGNVHPVIWIAGYFAI